MYIYIIHTALLILYYKNLNCHTVQFITIYNVDTVLLKKWVCLVTGPENMECVSFLYAKGNCTNLWFGHTLHNDAHV